MKEKTKGHLIIHGITEEEADKLMGFKILLADKNLRPYDADWWTQADIDTLDNAAMFAITTHNYPKPKTPKHYGENKK
jgi:hypothetical protein